MFNSNSSATKTFKKSKVEVKTIFAKTIFGTIYASLGIKFSFVLIFNAMNAQMNFLEFT